jgi:addiction module HigA family antidote
MDTSTKIPLGPAANTPGEILRKEFLEPLGLSQNELASKTGLDRMRISEIVRGRRRITPETAIALGDTLGTGPRFWLNLQNDYDLAIEAKKASRSVRLTDLVLGVSAKARHSSPIARAMPAMAKRKRPSGVSPKSLRPFRKAK